jgi:catechol 2,3-dioxygenase-like lactoylglutathione lyase family enzyme
MALAADLKALAKAQYQNQYQELPMLEHVSVPVKSYERSKDFYLAVLQPLGYVLQRAYPPEAAGFMEGNHTSFWISRRRKIAKIHVAFLAKSRKEVQGFYEAAIKAGGKDNGKPGRRKGYGYAAFIFDPDGHNIEAVHFEKGDD